MKRKAEPLALLVIITAGIAAFRMPLPPTTVSGYPGPAATVIHAYPGPPTATPRPTYTPGRPPGPTPTTCYGPCGVVPTRTPVP